MTQTTSTRRAASLAAPLTRAVAVVVLVAVAALVGHAVASAVAPVAAVPLLLGGWLVGFGVATALPFAVVAVIGRLLGP